MSVLGVGILGAGPVTQAIHLPTLATLGHRLRAVHVMDVDETVAAAVAQRADARWTTDIDQLLADPAVEVVAICSPHQFHADQIRAAADAGIRAILCEKPLATTVDQAQLIAEISASSQVPVVVGAMHAYDPAYLAAKDNWGDLAATAQMIRSVIYLPPNDEFVNLATDLVSSPSQTPVTKFPAPTPGAALRNAILGLATHTIPQIRAFMPRLQDVRVARFLEPFGYQIILTSEDKTVELLAVAPGQWSLKWTFEAIGADKDLLVEFPPSYVLAGSARATLCDPSGRREWHFATNGYQAEWTHLADVAEGRSELKPAIDVAMEDLVFVLALADAAQLALDTQP